MRSLLENYEYSFWNWKDSCEEHIKLIDRSTEWLEQHRENCINHSLAHIARCEREMQLKEGLLQFAFALEKQFVEEVH